MKLLIFSLICLAVATALLYSLRVRNFIAVQNGNRYKTPNGTLVEIVDILLFKDIYVFVGSNKQRYFEDGTRVGYIYHNDPHRLIRKI